jgi:hypothetical protein
VVKTGKTPTAMPLRNTDDGYACAFDERVRFRRRGRRWLLVVPGPGPQQEEAREYLSRRAAVQAGAAWLVTNPRPGSSLARLALALGANSTALGMLAAVVAGDAEVHGPLRDLAIDEDLPFDEHWPRLRADLAEAGMRGLAPPAGDLHWAELARRYAEGRWTGQRAFYGEPGMGVCGGFWLGARDRLGAPACVCDAEWPSRDPVGPCPGLAHIRDGLRAAGIVELGFGYKDLWPIRFSLSESDWVVRCHAFVLGGGRREMSAALVIIRDSAQRRWAEATAAA